MGNSKGKLGRMASAFVGGAVGTAVAFLISGCEMQHAFDRLIRNPANAGQTADGGPSDVMPAMPAIPEPTPGVTYSDTLADLPTYPMPSYNKPRTCHGTAAAKAYYDLCANQKPSGYVRAIETDDTSVVRDLSGNITVNAEGLALLDSVNGNIKIYGVDDADGSRAILKDVQDTAGSVLICHMDVDRISNFTRGNFTIVGGNLGNVDGFRGNLTVVGGEILSRPRAMQGQVRVVK